MLLPRQLVLSAPALLSTGAVLGFQGTSMMFSSADRHHLGQRRPSSTSLRSNASAGSMSTTHEPKPFVDPFLAKKGTRSPLSPGELLTREVDERISSILLAENTPSPDDALPVIAAELRELLLNEDESGRVSIWKLDKTNIQMVATSAQNEDDDALEGLDAAFDAKDSAFLYGLTRDESEHGLFKSKRQIEDNRIPNSPGYDQLIYAACLHRGEVVGVIGVGRRFAPGRKRYSNSWQEVHLTLVRAVADMISTSFNLVEGQPLLRDAGAKSGSITNYLSEQCTIEEQYNEVSTILGEVCDKCAHDGLLSVSMWEYETGDSSLLLYPGRRTRESCSDEFVETPADSCKVIKSSPAAIYLFARVDTATVRHVDDIDQAFRSEEDDLLAEWVQHGEIENDSKMARQIGVLLDTCNKAATIQGNKAAMKSMGCKVLSGVQASDQVVVILPLFFRGDLCAVLAIAIDGEAVKDPSRVSTILHEAVLAKKKLKWMSWKVQIIQSSNSLPLPNIDPLIDTIRSGNAVALTGAGFSIPANLMSWSGLLHALLDKAEATNRVNSDQRDFIRGLILEGTADSFDKAAQCLEDSLGMAVMQEELSKLLAIDREAMPRVMQRRIKIFNDIPWRAILTTNYDLCLEGPTPRCPDVGSTYINSLRQKTRTNGERLLEQLPSPVVKLHGCVNRGNIVFTRNGYRDLLYRLGGYQVFLQSLMASHTFVSIGHSGTDTYLNDLHSELLSMFGQSDLPLRYSIAPVSDGHASFAKSYDGLNYITWDKDTFGWGVVDLVLLKLRQSTNMRVRMAKCLRGRRILLVDSQNSSPSGGWSLVDLASLLIGILPTATVHVIGDSSTLSETVSNAASNVAPYDIVLMVYDKETTSAAVGQVTTPIGIISSDCEGCQRGVLGLQGQVLPFVIGNLAEAAEELFSFFETAMSVHGDHAELRNDRAYSRRTINMHAFL